MSRFDCNIDSPSCTIPENTGESAPSGGGGGTSSVHIIDSIASMNTYGSGTIGDTIVIPSTTTDQLHFTSALDGIKVISKSIQNISFDTLNNCELYVENFMSLGGGDVTNTKIMCDNMIDIDNTSAMYMYNSDIICDQFRVSNSGATMLNRTNVKAHQLFQSTSYLDNNLRIFEASNLEIGILGSDFGTKGIINGNSGLISFRITSSGKILKVSVSGNIVIYNSIAAAEIVGANARTY